MLASFAPVRLSPDDVLEAAAMMGRAAVDDPMFVYALPEATKRAAGAPLMLATSVRIALAHGEVWTTPQAITGVATWLSPSHPRLTPEDRDAAGAQEVRAAWGAEAFARFQTFDADVGGFVGTLAQEPHWHLGWLCVEPDHQGRGIGGRLVREMTARADAEDVPCELFTFVPKTVALYEHLGFRVTADTVLPRTGIRLMVMVRPSLPKRHPARPQRHET